MIEFRIALIVREVASRCTLFAKEIHAVRLAGNLVSKHVRDTIQAFNLEVDPEYVYDKVRLALEEEGVEIR